MITKYTTSVITRALNRLLQFDATIDELEKEKIKKALDTIGTWKDYPMTQMAHCPYCNNSHEVLTPIC